MESIIGLKTIFIHTGFQIFHILGSEGYAYVGQLFFNWAKEVSKYCKKKNIQGYPKTVQNLDCTDCTESRLQCFLLYNVKLTTSKCILSDRNMFYETFVYFIIITRIMVNFINNLL